MTWAYSWSSLKTSTSFHGKKKKSFLNEPPGSHWNLRTALNFTKGRLPFPCASNSTLWCAVQERKKREISSSYCGEGEWGELTVTRDGKRKGEKEKDWNAMEGWREEEAERAGGCNSVRQKRRRGEKKEEGLLFFSPLSVFLDLPRFCLARTRMLLILLCSRLLWPTPLIHVHTWKQIQASKQAHTEDTAHVLRYDAPIQAQMYCMSKPSGGVPIPGSFSLHVEVSSGKDTEPRAAPDASHWKVWILSILRYRENPPWELVG